MGVESSSIVTESCAVEEWVFGEAGSIGVAVVAAPVAVNILHRLEVLGDLARVHSAPTDSVLVSESLSEDCIWTDRVVPW